MKVYQKWQSFYQMLYRALNKICVISPISKNSSEQKQLKMSIEKLEIERSTSTKINQYQLNNRRPVSLSFNLGKIMPKTISHDKQTLYEQNLRLKESLKYLNNQVVKLRTRANISQNQTNKIIQASYSDLSKSNSNSQIEKMESRQSKITNKAMNNKISWMCLQSQGLVKSELKKAKEEIAQLKMENQKLRKSLKYTQIEELTIENERIREECVRMRKLVQNKAMGSVRDGFFQSALKNANEELTKQKENIAFMSGQIKNKVKEIEILKQEIANLKAMEIKLEKEMSEIKVSYSEAKKLIEEKEKEVPKEKEEGKMIAVEKDKQKEKEAEKQKQISKKPSTITKQPQSENLLNIPVAQQQKIYHHRNRTIKTSTPGQKSLKNSQKSIKSPPKPSQQKFQQTQLFKQLKKTLTYRFKSQRYTFHHFQKDIRGSDFNFFVREQIQQLLRSQPFFLQEESLDFVLKYVIEKNKKQVTTDLMIEKFRNLVEDFELISEKNQQLYLAKWQKILRNCQAKQKQKLHAHIFTEQQFIKWIHELQTKPEQLQMLLGQASMVSKSMTKINLQEFVDRILQY